MCEGAIVTSACINAVAVRPAGGKQKAQNGALDYRVRLYLFLCKLITRSLLNPLFLRVVWHLTVA